jgi:hypothetical protein
MGKGIHLNYLYDIETENEEHPAGYIFVLEYLGDRRGTIVRQSDGDEFYGYSPGKVHVDFKHKLAYLTDVKYDQELPTIYRKKKLEEDFEEDSLFEKTFCPDREAKFQTDFKNIGTLENTTKANLKGKKYLLKYDSNVTGNGTGLLENIQNAFDREGIKNDHLTENDHKFGVNQKPSDEENDDNDNILGEL